MKRENVEKFIVYEKLHGVKYEDAEFIQVGDSSGLCAVRPDVVEKYLGGAKYANLSCCAGTGYEGYLHMAKYALRKARRAKVLVLYISPYMPPGTYSEYKVGEDLYFNYIGARSYINIPGGAIRLNVLNLLYYGRYDNKLYGFDKPFEKTKMTMRGLREKMLSEKGWMPDKDKRNIYFTDCDFNEGFDEKRGLVSKLEMFRKFAKENNLKLAVMFNPVPCRPKSGGYSEAQIILNKYQVEHRDVYMPFNLETAWHPVMFNSVLHLDPALTERNSKRVGEALGLWGQ